MKIYLLRHADALDVGAGGIDRDEERPLSPQGIRQVRRVVGAIRKWGIELDAILTSPYLRARQTAEIVAEGVLGKVAVEESIELIPGSDPDRVLEALSRRNDGERLLLVGHLPLMGRLVSSLVWGKSTPELPFRKAGMACLTVTRLRPRPSGRLEWLLVPDQFPDLS